jgi:hypothetical protein
VSEAIREREKGILYFIQLKDIQLRYIEFK